MYFLNNHHLSDIKLTTVCILTYHLMNNNFSSFALEIRLLL